MPIKNGYPPLKTEISVLEPDTKNETTGEIAPLLAQDMALRTHWRRGWDDFRTMDYAKVFGPVEIVQKAIKHVLELDVAA